MKRSSPYFTKKPGTLLATAISAVISAQAGLAVAQNGLMIEEGGGVADQVFESNGVKLFVDPVSISYLSGAEVDFVDTVTGGGFTIKNPNAVSTCGCGSSFSV